MAKYVITDTVANHNLNGYIPPVEINKILGLLPKKHLKQITAIKLKSISHPYDFNNYFRGNYEFIGIINLYPYNMRDAGGDGQTTKERRELTPHGKAIFTFLHELGHHQSYLRGELTSMAEYVKSKRSFEDAASEYARNWIWKVIYEI